KRTLVFCLRDGRRRKRASTECWVGQWSGIGLSRGSAPGQVDRSEAHSRTTTYSNASTGTSPNGLQQGLGLVLGELRERKAYGITAAGPCEANLPKARHSRASYVCHGHCILFVVRPVAMTSRAVYSKAYSSLRLVALPLEEDLMPAPFMHAHGRGARKPRQEGHSPPPPGHRADVEPVAVPPPSHDRPDSAQGRRDALPQAVDCAQHARVRAAVVEQHDARWQGKRPRRDLQQEDKDDANPDEAPIRRVGRFRR
ncbi:hypothetical protein TCAP_02512, partial [Tolypocladium capitatum]